ncbi:hypothetical protein A3J91_03955 [Candidatus Peribacteria bacterium RIFOXYC2_FULL_58_10]|nr:MAG: hypothetical protein A3J91_03955 [Candidatus Peribacteria bacterium RIFOXYC2_FULL_58_10]
MEGHSRDMQDAMDDMKNTKNPMEAIAHLLRAFAAFMALLKGEKHPGVQQGRDALAAQGRRNALKAEVAATTRAGGKNEVDTLITSKQTALDAPNGPKKRLAGLEEAKVNLDANKTKKAQLEADEAKTPKPPEAPPPAPTRAQQIATLTEMINKAANYETEKATLQKEVDAAETAIKDLTAMKEEVKTAVDAENATLGRLRAAKPEALKGLDGITAGVGPDGISVVLKVEPIANVGPVRTALGVDATVLDNNGVVLDKDKFKAALTAKLDANFNGLKATNKFQRTIAGLESGKWTAVAGNADLAEGARLGATEVMNLRGNTLMKTPGGVQIMSLDGSVKRLASEKGKITDVGSQNFYDAVLNGVLTAGGGAGGKFIDAPAGMTLAVGDKVPTTTPPITQYSVELTTLTLSCVTADKKAYKYNPSGTGVTGRWSRLVS